MQLYVTSNANRQVGTADFQKAIEKTTGKPYQWFFDQWIYKIGLPKFEVTKSYNVDKKQLYIRVKQAQNQEKKSEYEHVSFFGGKIELEIDGKIEQIIIAPKAENSYVFSMEKAPGFVVFNFEETFFCETEFEQTPEEYLQQLLKSKDVLAKQKALDRLVEIAKDSSTTPVLKDNIVNAFKNEITTNLYWRYR